MLDGDHTWMGSTPWPRRTVALVAALDAFLLHACRIIFCACVIRKVACFDCSEWGYPVSDAVCIRCRHLR